MKHFQAILNIVCVVYIVLWLIATKKPNVDFFIIPKQTIFDIFAVLYLFYYRKSAKEMQQEYTFEIGDLQCWKQMNY